MGRLWKMVCLGFYDGAPAWKQMGRRAGGGAIFGASYTTKQCYEQALNLESRYNYNNGEVWALLGQHGGGVVGGQRYTRNECYAKALQISFGVYGAVFD